MSIALIPIVLGFACSGPSEPAPGPEVSPAPPAPPTAQAAERAFPPWDRWADCEAYCAAVKACGLAEAGEPPMQCYMGCDIAAQWEGQPMPDEHSAAVRETLLCAVQAADCAALAACLKG